MAEQIPPLYAFAVVPDVPRRLEELADLAEPEDWEYRNTTSEYPRPILFNYLHYSFARLEEQRKIVFSQDGEHACANTGLVTVHQEPVHMVFFKNRDLEGKTPWVLQGFFRRGEHMLTCFSALPEMATYCDDPTCLVFDKRLELRVNIDHVVSENSSRFPAPYKSMGEFVLTNLLNGAVVAAKERVARNYKAAVPQYYKGRVQLLLPICLERPDHADLALVVERFDSFYRASTCLTLDMAYNNARLIARPDRDWLQP
ncbi:MAG: DUF3825 domain-containing protein [Actinobacteria bacterium]|nr:DUF3825 domain-containing protein [Actinomycetota bacterium]